MSQRRKKLFEKFYKDEECLISKKFNLPNKCPWMTDILTVVELYDGLCTFFIMENVNTSSPLIYTIGYKTKEDDDEENIMTYEEIEELLHPKFKKLFKKKMEEYKNVVKEETCYDSDE